MIRKVTDDRGNITWHAIFREYTGEGSSRSIVDLGRFDHWSAACFAILSHYGREWPSEEI